MALELWTQTISFAQYAARLARRAEADGWAGMMVVDSQNLAGDSYVALAPLDSSGRTLDSALF